MQNLNLFARNQTNSISLDEYQKGGYNLFAFNLAPDLAYEAPQPLQIGNIRLDIRFSVALEKSINIVLLGLFDDEVQINEGRLVTI